MKIPKITRQSLYVIIPAVVINTFALGVVNYFKQKKVRLMLTEEIRKSRLILTEEIRKLR